MSRRTRYCQAFHAAQPVLSVSQSPSQLAMRAATVAPSDADDEPGQLVADVSGLALATADGRLVLHDVQPAGGQPMTGEEYLRGRPRILGRVVDSPAGAVAPPVFVSAGPAAGPA